jgi:hypothetical protein
MKKLLLIAAINIVVFSVILQAQEFSITIDAQKDAFYETLTGPSDGLVFLPARSFLSEIGTGPADDLDLSAKVWFCYDAGYLYCYAEVKDDIVAATSDQRYLNDCLELKLDPDPNSGTGSATANSRLTAKGEDDAEVPAGVDNLNGSAHLVDQNNAVLVTAEGEDYARRLTNDGYALEFRIPFDYINVPADDRYMIDRVVGGVFGMAINIGDNDNTTRDNMIQWSAGHADAAHSNPALLGSVIFLADHKVKLEAISPRDPSIVNDSADVWYTIPQTGDKKTIIFVSRPGYLDPATGESSDKPFIDELLNLGYDVKTFYNTALGSASQATLDTLDNADLIIIGRSSASNDFQPPNREAWNNIKSPLMLLQLWAARSSRLNWFNSDQCLHYNDYEGLYAFILEPDDPVFEGLYTENQEVFWCSGAYDVVEVPDAGNGKTLVQSDEATVQVQFVRFDPNIEFYDGSIDIPAGPRTFIGNGNDNPVDSAGNHIFNYYNFTDVSKRIYLNEVARMTGSNISSVKEEKSIVKPRSHSLFQNYPNPFNPSTTMKFSVPNSSFVTLKIYNNLGQEIALLLSEEMKAGVYTIQWNASGFSSGVYYYRLTAGELAETKKLVLLK